MGQLRIAAGKKFICCNHVQKNGENQQLFFWNLSKQRVREIFEKIFAVDLAKQADWVFLCSGCELLRRRGQDMTPSAPWHVRPLTRDITVETKADPN